ANMQFHQLDPMVPSWYYLRNMVHRLQFVSWGRSRVFGLMKKLAIHLRSEEHTSELQSRFDLVCRLLLEKKKKKTLQNHSTYDDVLSTNRSCNNRRVYVP